MPYLGTSGVASRQRSGSATVNQALTTTTVGAPATLAVVRIVGMSRLSVVAQQTGGGGGNVHLQVQQQNEWRTVGTIVLDGTVQYLSRNVTGRLARIVIEETAGAIVVDTLLSGAGGA